MSSVNKVILVGRLGKDPELRYTPSGTAIATWSMATSRRYKDRDGNLVEDTQWHNIKVWAAQAENCERYLSKGRQVFVEGRLESREYEKDGVKKYWTEIVAETVRFLGTGQRGANDNASAPEPAPEFTDADIPF